MVAVVAMYNLPRFFEFSLTCKTELISLREPDNVVANTTTITWSDVDAEATCSRVDCETALKKHNLYQMGYENVLYCLPR